MMVRAVFDGILNLFGVLAALTIIFMMLAVTYEVVMRYFLNRPTIWVIEVVEWSMVWITFLGAAWVLRTGGHVKMDIVLNRLSPRAQVLLNVVTSIIGALICLTLFWYSSQLTWDHFLRGVLESRMLAVPKAPLLVIIPVGSFLLFIQFLRRAYGYLSRWKALRDKEQMPLAENPQP